jgi:hypothetical protein
MLRKTVAGWNLSRIGKYSAGGVLAGFFYPGEQVGGYYLLAR